MKWLQEVLLSALRWTQLSETAGALEQGSELCMPTLSGENVFLSLWGSQSFLFSKGLQAA